MTWEDYYEKFYDWTESTQINRISSLTDFGPFDEILELTETLSEQGASKLIAKAVSKGVVFTCQEIVTLSEYLEKQVLLTLIKSCKEPFTPKQLSHIEGHSMVFQHELEEFLPPSDDFPPIEQHSQSPQPPYEKPQKIGFMANVGVFLLTIKFFRYIFGGKDEG